MRQLNWCTVRSAAADFGVVATAQGDGITAMNENLSLIVMCLFLLGSLAFLAEQLSSYH